MQIVRIRWNRDWPRWLHSPLDGTPEKFIQRVLKINASTKSLVERLCDFKIYAISVLSFIGSVCATTLGQGFEKIQAARGHSSAPIFALAPDWEKDFLAPSMSCSTTNAFDIICSLDRGGKLDEAPQDKKQKLATGLLRDKLYEQDFAGPISVRASKVLGPISRYRVVGILLHMKLVSRASRPGLTVGFFRILCNGPCTAQRLHTEDHEHTCRVRTGYCTST